jgi:hypothetical protein
MRAVFRSLILAPLATLSMWAHASCESGVLSDYVSIEGSQFHPKPESVRAADRVGTIRDFQYGLIIPKADGSMLEKWAAAHQGQGTRLGVIRRSDLQEGIIPDFMGAFFPKRNLLLLYEENKLGVNVLIFKHEGRHAEFDALLREGKCTVFAAQRIETFEELYTHAWHVLESKQDLRASVVEAFLKGVMKHGDFTPVEELAQFRSSLENIKNGDTQVRLRRNPGSPFPANLPRSATLLRSIEIETASPLLLGIHHVEIHGNFSIAVTLLKKGLHPVTLLFAHPAGSAGFADLKLELGITKLSGARAQRLLDLAIRRLNVLSSLTQASISSFEAIQRELEKGRSGEEAAKHLVDLLETYRNKIERPFSVEPETR